MAVGPGLTRERHCVVLGTATPGGGFPLFGAAFAEALAAVDPDLTIETRNTKGSTENVILLGAGALEIALVQGEVAGPALAAPRGTGAGLAVVAAMYATAGLFAVLRHSPHRASPISAAFRSSSARAAPASSFSPARCSTGSGSIRTRISAPSRWTAPATARRW